MGKKKQKRQHGRGERQPAHLSCTRLHGLPNRGNTCYFNAVLQAVCSAPTLTEALGKLNDARQSTASDQQPLAVAFARLAISLNSTDTRPTPPDQLLSAVRNRWPQFQGREQQDAQELYTMLLTGIEEEEAAAACNPDGTSATHAEKREAARLLSLVRFFLFPAGSRGVESRESEPLLLPCIASYHFLTYCLCVCTQCPLLRSRLLACGYDDVTSTAATRAASHAPSAGPAAILQSLFQGRLSCSLASHLDCFWDLSIEIPGATRQRHTGEDVDHCQRPEQAPSLDASKSIGADDVDGPVQQRDGTGTVESAGKVTTRAVAGDVGARVSATSAVDVVMALRNFCAPEMIDMRETRLSIWGDPPPVLTLHLKRFWQSQERDQCRFHKIDDPVHFNESECTAHFLMLADECRFSPLDCAR